jgi:hypothetical protein
MTNFVGCGWGRELVLQLSKILHSIREQFPKSYFALDFVYVGFVMGG